MFAEDISYHPLTESLSHGVVGRENQELLPSATDPYIAYGSYARFVVYRYGSMLLTPFYGHTTDDMKGLAHLAVAQGMRIYDSEKGTLQNAISIAARQIVRDAMRSGGFIHFEATHIEDATKQQTGTALCFRTMNGSSAFVHYSEDEEIAGSRDAEMPELSDRGIFDAIRMAGETGILSPQQVATLTAKYQPDEDGNTLNASEIARAEGKTPNTIITRIKKNLAMLRETLPAVAFFVENFSHFDFEEVTPKGFQVKLGAPYIALFKINPELAYQTITIAIDNQNAAGNKDISDTLKIAKAYMYRKLGCYAKAKSILRSPLQNDHARDHAFHELGNVYRSSGDLEAARHIFQSSIERAPYMSSTRTALAGVLLKMGEIAEAKKVLEEAIRLFPQSRRNIYLYAKVLMRQANGVADDTQFVKISNVALRVTDAFCKQYPEDGYAVLLKGEIFAIQSQRTCDSKLLQKARYQFDVAERVAFGNADLRAIVLIARERFDLN